MTKQQLIERRDELAKWLADNIDSIRWEEMKNEFNNICYKLDEMGVEVTESMRQAVGREFQTPNIYKYGKH